MNKLEKVELVREKCDVSYSDAKEALEACDYDVLDAIVWLEREGRAHVRTTTFETSATDDAPTPSEAMTHARQAYERQSKRTRFGEVWQRLMAWFKRACRAGLDTSFVVEKDGSRSFALPVLVLVLGLFFWGATIWLLVIGLFCGFHYHFEGDGPMTIDVNDMMDKAAKGAESIKQDLSDDEA